MDEIQNPLDQLNGFPDLSMIKFRMPSEEELEASCTERYAAVCEFMIDYWPEEIRALSFPTKMIKVDAAKIRQLYDHDWEESANELATMLDAEMGWENFFVRLNSRSPKDATDLPITCSGKQAISWIKASTRCLDDITEAYYAKKPVYICLREATYLHKDFEYRCFAKDGKVLAVSRYFYQDEPEAKPEKGLVMKAAESFYEKHLAKQYPDVVFDLYAPGTAQEILIEINPYGLSNPCLFESYEEIENEGGERL
jgi:hypothetical protein